MSGGYIPPPTRYVVGPAALSPSAILKYPHVAAMDSFAPSPDDLAIYYKGAGEAGVVLNIHMATAAALEPTAELRIYVDAGNIANLQTPPAASLAARIPLMTLLGLRWNTFDPNARDTAILAAAQLSLVTGYPMFDLSLPIPYSNGCLIQVWVNDAPAAVSAADNYLLNIEEGELPNWTYATWRLRSGAHDGIVQWDGSYPYDPSSCATWLDADGPGMLVGLYAAMKSLATVPTWGYLMNPWMMSMDGGERTWHGIRTEHVFGPVGIEFELGLLGNTLAHTWGLTNASPEAAQFEAYRLFTKAPVIWSQGCIGEWTNHYPGVGGDSVEAHILALYYGA